MPEGDTLHRVARQLQILVGEQVAAESPHPRARATRVAEQLDGRRLESVQAIGKNLILRFEGGVVLRSHLRMSGRWAIWPIGSEPAGRPWLVLRGTRAAGVLWGGPVLELHTRALAALGPDILGSPPDLDSMLTRWRVAEQDRRLGEILQDQHLVAGIGNMWMAETLWRTRFSPWLPLRDVDEADRRCILETAARLMRAAVDSGRGPRTQVHGRAGQPCSVCGTRIAAWGQGDHNRTAYWCTACQPGPDPSRLAGARSRTRISPS